MLVDAILTLALAGCVYFLIRKPKNKNLPPGPSRWPIIGNIPELAMINAKLPHLAMEELAKKYGDVMRIGFGVHDACVLSSYEAIKEIFHKDDASDRFVFDFVTDRSFHKTLGIIWSKGLMASKIRKFSAKGLREFGFGKQKSMDVIIREDIEDLVSFMKESCQDNNGEMEIDPHCFAGSLINIIWSLVAGYRFPVGDPRVRAMLEHGNRMSEIVGPSNPYNALPFLRHMFPKWTNYDKHTICHSEYQEFVKEMIHKAKDMQVGRSDSSPENFIEVFLDEIEKTKEDPNTIFTEEQLIVVLMDLFLAGSETTGTTMTWSTMFLALYPDVQSKIREEVINVAGYGPINIGDFQRMPYLKATIFEIFRVSNLAPTGGPPRTAITDIPYRDFIIPKGCILMVNLGPIFKDKAYWGDPEVFRPERFLDETGTKVINTERVSTIFGMGKRICFGESFVWNALPMYLATLIRTFTLSSIPGREPTAEDPRGGGTLLPKPYSLKLSWD